MCFSSPPQYSGWKGEGGGTYLGIHAAVAGVLKNGEVWVIEIFGYGSRWNGVPPNMADEITVIVCYWVFISLPIFAKSTL